MWISTLISMQGHSEMDIRKQYISMNGLNESRLLWILVFNYPSLYGYPFGYPWISMGIHALTCYGFSIQRCLTDKGKVSITSDTNHDSPHGAASTRQRFNTCFIENRHLAWPSTGSQQFSSPALLQPRCPPPHFV